jgi:single stranded DNA-binding protein
VIYLDFQKISVCLIGNATKDAVVKTAKESGTAYGDFHLAVRDRQKETHYFPVRCFGKLAENVATIKKGAKVFVDGELELGAFAGEDGTKQMTFRVVANAYRILGNGRRADAGKIPAPSEPVQAAQ